MPILDERGRIFGRINIIDAGVLTVVLLLIPLVYGAYLLFRTPPATLQAIVPDRIPMGTTQVRVRGEHLRPYLRVAVGNQDATLLFQDPTSGVLQLPALVRPGSYDIALYDETQELMRLRDALVVEPYPAISAEALLSGQNNPSLGAGAATASDAASTRAAEGSSPSTVTARLLVVGTFTQLSKQSAGQLTTELASMTVRDAPWEGLIGLRAPEPMVIPFNVNGTVVPVSDGKMQVRAVIAVTCTVIATECWAGGLALAQEALLPVTFDGGVLPFRIDELHPRYTGSVEIRVRTALSSAAIATLTGRGSSDPAFPALKSVRPIVRAIVPLSEAVGYTERAVDVVLRVPVVKRSEIWTYREQALRVGEQFAFASPLVRFSGPIVALEEVPAS